MLELPLKMGLQGKRTSVVKIENNFPSAPIA